VTALRWIVTLVAVAACGHPDAAVVSTPAPAPVPTPVAGDASTAMLDRATVICDRAVRCGTIGASQLAECKGPTGRLTLVWGYPDLLGVEALVAAKRLRRDVAAEQPCLAKLAGAACRDRSADTACSRGYDPLAANVAPGGACKSWDECIDGFCSTQAGCQGTCIARSKLGEACGANQICTEDAFCWKGTCRKRAVAGETCGGHWQWCAEGLFCAGYAAEADTVPYRRPEVLGTCRAPLGVGESCLDQQDGRCRTELYCAWGDPAPTCQQPLASGATCRWLDACADGLACSGLTLHGVAQGHSHFAVARAGTCAPVLDTGSPCDPTAFVSGCPQSMRCDRTTKRCRSAGHVGDHCESSWITKPHPEDEPIDNDGCFSSNYCDVATRTCKKQLPIGAACTPQTFGVEDEPCFLATCDPKSRRCVAECR
jgi:hypothetical protein